MKRPTIFLNELSFITDRELGPQELRPHILATLKTARESRKIARELIVVGALSEILFGVGQVTLQSLLHGADYRDEWRSLKELEQSSPYEPDAWTVPGEMEEIIYDGRPGLGLLQAVTNKSAILSFAFIEAWGTPILQAKRMSIDELEGEMLSDIEILNLAIPEHVVAHSEFLRGLGVDLSSSSIVFENDEFVLRIYFNDHDPPHFHIMAPHKPSETIARFRIDNLDQLSQLSSLQPGLRRRIVGWAESRKEILMRCWVDCQLHRHPTRIE